MAYSSDDRRPYTSRVIITAISLFLCVCSIFRVGWSKCSAIASAPQSIENNAQTAVYTPRLEDRNRVVLEPVPNAVPLLPMRILSTETAGLKKLAPSLIEITKNEDKELREGDRIALSDVYVGTSGSLFGLMPDKNVLFVRFPDQRISLELQINVKAGKPEITQAHYQLGCNSSLTSDAKRHLDNWFKKGHLIQLVEGAFQIDVPNPAVEEHAVGIPNQVARDQCSYSIDYGKTRYYDLKITSFPQGAAVYVDGKYIGTTNVPLRITYSTVDVLVRKAGFADAAKRVSLVEGANEFSVKLKKNQ